MKILIIGEYSAFAKYLSRGFRLIGHDCFVFSWGDRFKRIEQDNDSYYVNVSDYKIGNHVIRNSNRIRNRFSGIKLHHYINKMKKEWDCAIIINFGFLKLSNNPLIPFVTISQIKSLLKDESRIYLSACGGDYIFYKYIVEKGGFSAFEVEKAKKDIINERNKYLRLITSVKGIIPITINYEQAYNYYQSEYHYRLFPIIPLPFDVDSVNYSQVGEGKIIIMHGVNRYEAKGSNYIIPAMRRIKEDYPDLVEIDIIYHIPLSEYLLRMERATIVIDQCYGGSAGMNAIEALAMGKVVLGRNEAGNAESLGEENFPVISIEPNEEDIYNKIKELITSPDRIKKISSYSREFACRVYDCKKVAEQYVELFKKEK